MCLASEKPFFPSFSCNHLAILASRSNKISILMVKLVYTKFSLFHFKFNLSIICTHIDALQMSDTAIPFHVLFLLVASGLKRENSTGTDKVIIFVYKIHIQYRLIPVGDTFECMQYVCMYVAYT